MITDLHIFLTQVKAAQKLSKVLSTTANITKVSFQACLHSNTFLKDINTRMHRNLIFTAITFSTSNIYMSYTQ